VSSDGLTEMLSLTAPVKPFTLVTVTLVEASSSQSLLEPSHRLDSPIVVRDVELADKTKSACPVATVTVILMVVGVVVAPRGLPVTSKL
jgi:hypothetical protein